MAIVVGVRFKSVGKIYYFDPTDIEFSHGEYAIVETVRGIECGIVAMENREVPDEEVVHPLKPVIRKATEEDVKRVEQNKIKEKEALVKCGECVERLGLDMKLVDVEYTLDGGKIVFYFTADGRVDFRELVKELAATFRTRIELRQIGVRDEAKMLGGLGICGNPFCCSSFLGEFIPVSIKMAKEQGLSLNPTKISGTCGRLMCCLKYEQDAYESLLKITPKVGAFVNTEHGRGTVIEANLLTGKLRVKLESNPDGAPVTVDRRDVKMIRDGYIKVDAKEAKALRELEE